MPLLTDTRLQHLLFNHLGNCQHTATTLVQALSGPNAEHNARAIIGSLALTSTVLSVEYEANDPEARGPRTDVARLCGDLADMHTDGSSFS